MSRGGFRHMLAHNALGFWPMFPDLRPASCVSTGPVVVRLAERAI